jgi:hypothetical protein
VFDLYILVVVVVNVEVYVVVVFVVAVAVAGFYEGNVVVEVDQQVADRLRE